MSGAGGSGDGDGSEKVAICCPSCLVHGHRVVCAEVKSGILWMIHGDKEKFGKREIRIPVVKADDLTIMCGVCGHTFYPVQWFAMMMTVTRGGGVAAGGD